MLIADISRFENCVDPDQLASKRSADQHLYCLQFGLHIHLPLGHCAPHRHDCDAAHHGSSRIINPGGTGTLNRDSENGA